MKHSEIKEGSILPTNRDGNVRVVSKNGKVVVVEFINTGYRREVLVNNLRNGKCKDLSIANRKFTEETYPYTLMSSNSCGDFILLVKDGKSCVVQFIDTGYTTQALWSNVKAGRIRDPYARSGHGVGFLGEFERNSYWKQAMQLWRNMLKRCYSEKDVNGYLGKGVTVDSRWHCFASFLEDLPNLENFDLWLHGQNSDATKYNLDKDFKIPGNKVYSKNTCMFLTEAFNKSLTSRTNKWDGINEPVLRP